MYRLRSASPEDLDALAAIEAASFPEAEACSRETFAERLGAFRDAFLILEADGRPIGLIDGMCSNQSVISDNLYAEADRHDPRGAWQMVFGIAVLPEYRKQGCGSLLMKGFIEKAKQEGRKGVVLTCKDTLKPFYERFGFVCGGVSESVHGGAVWYDMTLVFRAETPEASS